MLHNSIFVEMKVYPLQRKQKSTAGVSNGLFQNLEQLLSIINFWGFFWKVNRGEEGREVTLVVSGFPVFMLFLHKSGTAEPFNLDYVIYFYIPNKKGLSSPVFTVKILVVQTFGCY